MKANILISGASGYIGKHLIESLDGVGNIYALTKYKEDMINDNIRWRKCDIYNIEEMITALENIDIAIYYLDPNKKSAKLTQSNARNLNKIASDNMSRACRINGVKKIVYISGSPFDEETIETLKSSEVEVEVTEQSIKRPAVSIELQRSKYNDVRSVHRMPLPYGWEINDAVVYYFNWLQETSGTLVQTKLLSDTFNVFFKHSEKPLLQLKEKKEIIDQDIIRFEISGGKLAVNRYRKNGTLEFRKIKETNEFMVHLYDYVPRLPWGVYYFSQAPIHNVTMKGFEVDCRIKDFQLRTNAGQLNKYTK